MARPGAALTGLALGAGATLLFAAVAPHLPAGERLATIPAGDPRHAPLVGAGLLLLLAGSLLLALIRRSVPGTDGARLAASVGAALAPLLIGLPVLIRAWPGLWSPAATPELDRLLLVGATIALAVAPPVAWLLAARPREPRELRLPAGWERIGIGAVLVVFGGVVVLGMAERVPFSWDEAVYALTTRHWVQGTPDTGWGIHRPPVLSALGIVPLAFGSEEALFRVIGLAFGLAAVAATWLLGRTLAGPAVGLIAAMVVAAAPTIQIDAGLFLNDVPAMAILLVLLVVTWRTFERPGPVGWAVLWLAPIAAAAFYVRYGSVLSLAAIGLAAVAIWPGRIAAAWPKVLAAAGLLLALLLPHAVFAVAQTGSPLGVWQRAQAGSAGAYLGAGLEQYLAWLPSQLLGLIPAAVAVIGLLGAAHHLASAGLRGEWSVRSRAFGLLVIPAMVQIGVLGLFQLPQGRYIFLPMVLLVVAGAAVLVGVMRAPGRLGRITTVAVAGGIALALVISAVEMPRRADDRSAVYEWLREAGAWIRAAGGSCSILASDVPQLTWYSGCPTYNFGDRTGAQRDARLTGEHRYLVVRRDGRFQPDRELMAEYLSRAEPAPAATFRNRNGVVVGSVYRFIETPG